MASSPLVIHRPQWLLPAIHCQPFTAHKSPPTIHRRQFAAHNSPPTIHHPTYCYFLYSAIIYKVLNNFTRKTDNQINEKISSAVNFGRWIFGLNLCDFRGQDYHAMIWSVSSPTYKRLKIYIWLIKFFRVWLENIYLCIWTAQNKMASS